MSEPEINYAAVFRALPSAVLLMDPELSIVDANDAYLRLTGRELPDLLGRHLFDAFPDNPSDPGATGTSNLGASLKRVLEGAAPDTMPLQRYDVERTDRPGVFEEKYWSPVNAPVLGPNGQVKLIMHRVEEVTDLVQHIGMPEGGKRQQVLEAELYARARELAKANEHLRQAHARERQVALTLQSAMLPTPKPFGKVRGAVRYRPAADTLNVCGDWYDLVTMPDGRIAVAVGDVVGHGLAAAGVMGQLRSAISASVRVAGGPAQALDALEVYAESVQGAEATTVIQAVIDNRERSITYSSAGHPPPILLHPNGAVEFLDRATDPPLGTRLLPSPRPEARTHYLPDSLLVLYSDGLIERRGEDIDIGLARLAGSLVRHARQDPEALADSLLADLEDPQGTTDDTALIVLRLTDESGTDA
ncbi:hypothetical protein GCM10009716_17810 [Streptomyces sodiiphilus]|uniref:PAS domain-containing protein n=1 Tax=Streptomyces sodiiphilus TaxID=226217 RepID=A0ABN2NZU4_9ACTN